MKSYLSRRRTFIMAFVLVATAGIGAALLPQIGKTRLVVSRGDIYSLGSVWGTKLLFDGKDTKFLLDEKKDMVVFGRGWKGAVPETELTGGTNIWMMRNDGSGLRQITDGYQSIEAHLAPDAQSVFVVNRDQNIYRYWIDGRKELIREKAYSITVSPDGRYLAYNKLPDTWSMGDYLNEAKGLQLLDLTTMEHIAIPSRTDAWSIMFTPDSSHLLYFASSELGLTSLYSVRRDGTDERQLTNIGKTFYSEPGIVDSPSESPTFSPNGKRVAYHSDYKVWVLSFSEDYAKVTSAKLVAYGRDPKWKNNSNLTAVVGADSPMTIAINLE